MENYELILDRFWEVDLPDVDETGCAMENELEQRYLASVTNDLTKVNGIDTWHFDNIPYLYSACLQYQPGSVQPVATLYTSR